MTVRFGGDLRLTGSYTAPQVGGFVRVEQGELFLDEFVRAAEVVDLTDPLLRDLADSTFAGVAPEANPFLQNLRVDVELALQRDFWLRSAEINTEIGGNLLVTYDRPEREIVLVGELEAVRGTYEIVGKQFQVSGGTVTFVGTPGINPALNIEAVTRLRREAGDPLNITARVQGTLASPRVTLTSDAQPPIVESDLISYLIFGRPSYALASGETSVLRRSLGAGEDYVVGTIASRLGTAVARQIGVDYFTITQTQDAVGLESAAGLSGSFANTQIEVGHYVGQDLFLALLLRPLTGLGAVSRTQFPGVRLEWRFTDTWSVEGFVEDRFAREPSTGFGALGLRLSKVLGLSLYREWGY
jgi:autotransporter translocation and assembly factor TamB